MRLPVFLVLGCIFAAEGYLVLWLASWLLQLEPHWIVTALVSLTFFGFGLIVAGVVQMAALQDDGLDEAVTTQPGRRKAARRAVGQRNHSEANAA
jgi:hypothetical protein